MTAVTIPQVMSFKDFVTDIRSVDVISEDKYAYGPNEFAMALYDSSLLTNRQRFFYYTKELNLPLHWFELNNAFLYTYYEAHFTNYLTYLLIMKCISGNEYEPVEIEKYFTDQLVAFYFNKKMTNKLGDVYKVWSKASDVIVKFLDIIRKGGTNIVCNSHMYLRSHRTNKAVFGHNIPIIEIINKRSIRIHLILCHNGKKPHWYSIPFLYKIIGYYLKMDITPVHIILHWFDLSEAKPNVTEEVLYYEEIKTIIDKYKDISPLPYKNIFNPHTMTTYYQILNQKELF